MANRRLAKGARSAQKKKSKASKKEGSRESATRATTASASPRATFFTGGGPGLSGNAGHGRLKISAKKLKGSAGGLIGKRRQKQIAAVKKKRSVLRKQQQVERMTLKEHLAELERRRISIRKGDSAKQERRELGKYIRQLKEEQQVKHAAELANVEEELKRLINAEEETKKRPHHSRFAVGQVLNEEEEDGANDAEDWEDVPQVDSDDSIDEDRLQDMFAHLIA